MATVSCPGEKALLELGGREAPGCKGPRGGRGRTGPQQERTGLNGGTGRESFPCHYLVVTFEPCHLTCLSLNLLFRRVEIMLLQQ